MKNLAYLLITICAITGVLMKPLSAEVIGGINFPDGVKSFADEVVSYSPGPDVEWPYSNPNRALGVPDGLDACLGEGGYLKLKFSDNSLTTSGDSTPDLHIFEIGNAIEWFNVKISVDGTNFSWIDLGDVKGQPASIDIDSVAGVVPGAKYSYVILSDVAPDQSGPPFGEADIDAVGAISSAPPQCKLTAWSDPPEGGSIARSPDQTMYSPGAEVVLIATPAAGYTFLHWSGDVSGSENPATITMDSDKSITAHFRLADAPTSLTVLATEGGMVTVTPPGDTVVYRERRSFEYPGITDVNVLAEETDPDYVFWCWAGSAAEKGKVDDVSDSKTTVRVDDDDDLCAAFLRTSCPETSQAPAPCRGAVGSTSQCWDFGDGETADPGEAVYNVTGWASDGLMPLPGTSLGCADFPPDAYELWWANDPEWGSAREGLLSVSGLRAEINVWESSETRTTVWLHLVWHKSQEIGEESEIPSEPVLSDFQPFALDDPILMAEETDPNGWHDSTYMWSVSPSPETVAFTLRGQIVIDALIVETCTDPIRTIHVDDDAPFDPGPYDIDVSDPEEDGTGAHPFDSVQEGIEVARDGDTVLVHDGRYVETIYVSHKAITVIGQWLRDPAVLAASIIDANGVGPVVHCVGGKDRGCTISGLTIMGGKGLTNAAILCDGAEPFIANCLITGNMALAEDGTIVTCIDSEPNFVNCTISGNRAGPIGAVFGFVDTTAVLTNSIVWDNDGPELLIPSGAGPEISYSDVVSNWNGLGILHSNPCFVKPGYWDALGSPDDLTDDVWIEGDYHLLSNLGRFDVETETWVFDTLFSPCIDAGNPSDPVGAEPQPRGARINMGTYGGTVQASKSVWR